MGSSGSARGGYDISPDVLPTSSVGALKMPWLKLWDRRANYGTIVGGCVDRRSRDTSRQIPTIPGRQMVAILRYLTIFLLLPSRS